MNQYPTIYGFVIGHVFDLYSLNDPVLLTVVISIISVSDTENNRTLKICFFVLPLFLFLKYTKYVIKTVHSDIVVGSPIFPVIISVILLKTTWVMPKNDNL